MSKLLEKTLSMLEDSPEKLEEISQGSGVNLNTLKKIKSGATPNPGVKTVESLYVYLMQRNIYYLPCK